MTLVACVGKKRETDFGLVKVERSTGMVNLGNTVYIDPCAYRQFVKWNGIECGWSVRLSDGEKLARRVLDSHALSCWAKRCIVSQREMGKSVNAVVVVVVAARVTGMF